MKNGAISNWAKRPYSLSIAVGFALMGLWVFASMPCRAQPSGQYVFVSVQGTGVVNKTPDQSAYALGDLVALTAVPARYFSFSHWEDGNTSNPRVITVGPKTVYEATFTNTVPLESLGISFLWEETFGGNRNDVFKTLELSYGGGFLLGGSAFSGVSGNKESVGFGSSDFWIVRLDADGNKLWDRSFGGTDSDSLGSIRQTSDGGFVLGGSSNSGTTGNKVSPNFGRSDYWVVRLDVDGGKLWDKSFGGGNDDTLNSLVQTSDGGFILGGYSSSGATGNKTIAGFGGLDYWIVRLDANGNKLWDKSYGGSGDEYLNDLELASEGGFILGGQSNSGATGNKASANFGSYDFWFVALDPNGVKLWDRSFGGRDHDSLDRVQQTADGGFILGGYSQSGATGNKASPSRGGFDFWVVRLDTNGDKLWDSSVGGSNEEYLSSLEPTREGGFILGGYSRSGSGGSKTAPNLGGYDFWTVGLNADGNIVWDRSFGGSGNDVLFSLRRTFDGGFMLGGYSDSAPTGTKNSPKFGESDFWVIKVAEALAPIGTPTIAINGQLYVSRNVTFDTVAQVELRSSFRNGSIFYSLDGSSPTFSSLRYGGMFSLTKSATIRAIAYSADFSVAVEADPVSVVSRPAFPMSVSTLGGGTVAIDPSTGPYLSNSIVNIRATNAPGWSFLRWTGDAVGTNTSLAVTVKQPQTIQAVFGTTVNTTIAGQGTVVLNPPQALIPFGSVLRLTAIPEPGHYFGLWGNASRENFSPLDFVVTNANPTISALFAPLNDGQFALTLLTTGNGQIGVDPRANAFSDGQTVSLTATPEGESRFLGWSGDAAGSENPLKIAMDRSKSITANFIAGTVPWLGSPQARDGGAFEFAVFGAVGGIYRIQASTNLLDWADLSQITNVTGTSIFSDPTSTESLFRYYRASSP